MNKWLHQLTNTRTIAFSFLIIILSGTLLLTLPAASVSGQPTSFPDALFTAVSATCVTGLSVQNTGLYWSLFGQIVILSMIQIGGLGFMTFMGMLSIFLKRKISLTERKILMQSAGNMQLSGMVRLVKHIVQSTLLFELFGSLLLSIRFIPQFGLLKGIYYSVFHSVSAFCNAGFDLMGASSSLTAYESDWLVNITIMLLIICGGLGFLVWTEIGIKKWHFAEYSLHAKIVLLTTAVLILTGTIGYLIFEWNGSMAGYPLPKRILSSLFMSVTTRTAGFNTLDLSALSNAGLILSLILMFIGGSPGSTAGGIKTTTIAVIILTVIHLSKGNENVTVMKKRLDHSTIRQAAAIMLVYLTGILLSCMAICFIESDSLGSILFEIVSAIGTVGLSQGITAGLCDISKFILILLMYGGRIGALSLLMVFRERAKEAPLRRPTEKILIG